MVFLFPLLAFGLCVPALWIIKRAALKFGYADTPGGRKKHDMPVPPIGGLVILPAFFGVATLAGLGDFLSWPLASGIGALLLMGALDEKKPIRPFIKFTLMVWIACFVVIFGETQIGSLGNLFGFGVVQLGWLSKGFTILALVLLMNAINMMDGIDGLAGGFCALVAFWLMFACAGAGQWEAFQALAILLACLVSFLIYNLRTPWRKSASIFMGDAGALSLGLLLGWFCIQLAEMNDSPLRPVTIIWIIAIPVIDAFALFVARSLRGLHPFNADRRHLHHRFIDAGLSPAKTTFAMLGLIAFFALAGFFAQDAGIPEAVMFYLWIGILVMHIYAILHPQGYTLMSRLARMRGRRRNKTI